MDQKEVMKALSQLQGNAGLVSALQQKLDGLVGMSSGFVESLHFKIRARVEELGNLQENHDELYEKFLEEKRELEVRGRGGWGGREMGREGGTNVRTRILSRTHVPISFTPPHIS